MRFFKVFAAFLFACYADNKEEERQRPASQAEKRARATAVVKKRQLTGQEGIGVGKKIFICTSSAAQEVANQNLGDKTGRQADGQNQMG